jgi:hypothetical protein
VKPIVQRRRQAAATPTYVNGTEESLYAKWSRACLELRPVWRELREILGVLPLGRSVFGPPFLPGDRDDRYSGLIAALGIDPTTFAYSAGKDLFLHGDSGTLARRTLRYCPRCIAHGYHATLFQHVALEKCPLHDVPLLGICTLCGYAFKPTWESVARHPFACSCCGHLLLRTVVDPRRDIEVRLVELMVAERRRLLDFDSKNTSHFRAPLVSMPSNELDARLRRGVLRHALWTGSTLPGWNVGRTSHIYLPREKDISAHWEVDGKHPVNPS